jgi:hypothetical protein
MGRSELTVYRPGNAVPAASGGWKRQRDVITSSKSPSPGPWRWLLTRKAASVAATSAIAVGERHMPTTATVPCEPGVEESPHIKGQDGRPLDHFGLRSTVVLYVGYAGVLVV